MTKTLSLGGLEFTWDCDTGKIIGCLLNTGSKIALKSVEAECLDGRIEIKIDIDVTSMTSNRPGDKWVRGAQRAPLCDRFRAESD